MENPSNNGSALCQLSLEGELTIYTAPAIKERLLAPLSHCPQIEVDLSQVSEMDSAGLQLMLLAKREASAQSREIHFVAPSPAVLEVLELYQLAGYFASPAVMAAVAAQA